MHAIFKMTTPLQEISETFFYNIRSVKHSSERNITFQNIYVWLLGIIIIFSYHHYNAYHSEHIKYFDFFTSTVIKS